MEGPVCPCRDVAELGLNKEFHDKVAPFPRPFGRFEPKRRQKLKVAQVCSGRIQIGFLKEEAQAGPYTFQEAREVGMRGPCA